MNDLAALFDKQAAWAERTLIKFGRFEPMFVLHTKTDTIPVSMPDYAANRSLSQRMLSLLAIAHEAVAITTMMETWMAEENSESDRPPSERDDRREALVVMMQYRERGTCKWRSSLRQIERDDNNKISLGPSMVGEYDRIEGPDLLSPEDPPPGAAEIARKVLERMGVQPKQTPRPH